MRTRNLKPGFFKNEELAALGPYHMILFEGLWCMADCEGRLEDRPKRVKAEVLPYFDVDVDALLSDLEVGGFIRRYVVNGVRYLLVLNFKKHQWIGKTEQSSELPPPSAPQKPSRKRTVIVRDEHSEKLDENGNGTVVVQDDSRSSPTSSRARESSSSPLHLSTVPKQLPSAHSARRSWITPYEAIWHSATAGGLFPIGEAAKRLAPLRAQHGEECLVAVWRHYLEHKNGEFLSPTDFAKHFGYWLEQMRNRAAPAVPGPVYVDCATCGDCHREGEHCPHEARA